MSGRLHRLQKVSSVGRVVSGHDWREPVGLSQSHLLERPDLGNRDILFRAVQKNRALLRRVTFEN